MPCWLASVWLTGLTYTLTRKVQSNNSLCQDRNVRYIEFSAPEFLSNFSEFPVTNSHRAVTSNSSGTELQNNLRQPDSFWKAWHQHQQICILDYRWEGDQPKLRQLNALYFAFWLATNHSIETSFQFRFLSSFSHTRPCHYLGIAKELLGNWDASAQELEENLTHWFTNNPNSNTLGYH